jgi:hypothetical protein
MPGTVSGCNVAILGVGGQVKCKVKGTVCWTIEDDQGRAHCDPGHSAVHGPTSSTTFSTALGTGSRALWATINVESP